MHVSRRVEFLKWQVVRGDHVIVNVMLVNPSPR